MNKPALKLKTPAGWFAAGSSFGKALTLLSDGAFKLFAWICLQAERPSGRFEATYMELATALGKSKRIIGAYVAELEAAALCQVQSARNQHARTVFQVCEEFWPYCRVATLEPPAQQDPELDRYVTSIRDCYLSLGHITVNFGAADRSIAKNFFDRRIPLGFVRDAMLLGACRKYESWFSGKPPQVVQSLRYFEPIIAEVRTTPLPAGYSNYLRRKLHSYAAMWETGTDTMIENPAATDARPRLGLGPSGQFSTALELLVQKGNQQQPSKQRRNQC
jgi:hypothetical protein